MATRRSTRSTGLCSTLSFLAAAAFLLQATPQRATAATQTHADAAVVARNAGRTTDTLARNGADVRILTEASAPAAAPAKPAEPRPAALRPGEIARKVLSLIEGSLPASAHRFL